MVRKLAYSVSEREHWISAAGGLLGILAVLWVSHALLGDHVGALTVASMGASAVLLFAAPHGALSQPWPVVGGHLISAAVGVTCAQWIADPMLAASIAVAASIGLMYWLRCLHPPGGATALFAVMGGEPILTLGYGYLFVPVLLNVVVLLIVAVLFNFPFAWRRYPQAWWRESVEALAPAELAADAAGERMIPHSDLVYALSQLDTFIDVSEEDLQRIYTLALGHGHTPHHVPVSLMQEQVSNA
ncbi:MAG: HPP family protein [Thiobacillus sp.]|nr:HPP family protein [Gammaproteobacteria bacterium]MBU4499165.1 HPP family protein [Gammaproteobacteria bacterium]MDO9007702.1 HPP family protein [Thiobacillus sp.]MDP1923746.1 HPP family protein [Thiobacillus sp.]MDP3125311.1 HPP family protein [Thiobacillus sp.]